MSTTYIFDGVIWFRHEARHEIVILDVNGHLARIVHVFGKVFTEIGVPPIPIYVDIREE